MKYPILILAAFAFYMSSAAPASAGSSIDYISDPLFEPIDGGDSHPLQGLFELAEASDARAQFILGDLYSKGKGGIPKNVALSKILFEHSAKLGHYEAFIRLAALAKEDKNYVSAWKWYTLANERLKWGETRDWATKARKELEQEMSAADKKAARSAVKQWKVTRLKPLKLEHPLNPLGKKSKPAAPVDLDAELKAEQAAPDAASEKLQNPETETKAEAEKDLTDEQN
jgi:hypothetical protein